MAIDARQRSSLYEKLAPLIGEEDANVMLSQFPAGEIDELVTRHFLRAEIAEVKHDLTVRMIAITGTFTGTATALLGILVSTR